MADHKTMIGGTSYKVGGGKCLVGGSTYSIKEGKTLIGGANKTISFINIMQGIEPGKINFNFLTYYWRVVTTGTAQSQSTTYSWVSETEAVPIAIGKLPLTVDGNGIVHLPGATFATQQSGYVGSRGDLIACAFIGPLNLAATPKISITGRSGNSNVARCFVGTSTTVPPVQLAIDSLVNLVFPSGSSGTTTFWDFPSATADNTLTATIPNPTNSMYLVIYGASQLTNANHAQVLCSNLTLSNT